MKIVIDIDSSTIDTCRSIINLHNKLYDNKIEYQEDYSWNFYPMIKTIEELKELFKLFDHKDFYKSDTLVVFDKAIQVINGLSMQNKVIFCSKHDIARRPITSKWIYEIFPTANLEFTDTFNKSIVGKVDIVIDDKPEALLSVDADYKILFGTYDWNKDYNGLRANNWKEVDNMIKIIENTTRNNKLNDKVINNKRMVGDNER